RFGLFIHWGLYALPARHEWVKNREKIRDEDYQKYFDHFCPDLYDPAVWAKAAKNAGMKYFVVTSKHHEGFCLWDSALTDYKATRTPWGKDLLHPMVDAFRAEGLKVGFYHSLIDWHHPEFPVDSIHPRRDDEAFKEREKGRDIRKYAEYLHGQARELVTQFGKVDIMWFDFSYSRSPGGKGKEDWQSEKLMAMVRALQPGVIVNDRLEIGGDIKTPEQWQPRGWVKVDGKPVVWEACQTLNGSWGYDRDNRDWKPVDLLIRMLIDTVSKGGNLLLNVGPTGRGEFDPRALQTLAGIGEWMRRHSRAIYGCAQSEFQAPSDCRFTQNGKRLYCHVFAWPLKALHLDGLVGKVAYAQLLNDASEIRMTEGDARAEGYGHDTLTLTLPIQKPDVAVPVIELFLK
ncbi:MAG: alpha-L-fucosidase, partial [Armatimonadetes bacterium]|nr:alpha-L-fucosidase [Armatimonadota bacterium]